MATQTVQELVQLAQCNSQTLQYLHNLPEYMASTVDTALVVEDVIYPVHSFILLSASPIFADMVALHYAEVVAGKANNVASVLAIPLLGSSKATTQVALQFIYQHLVLVKHETLPQVCNREEAEDLMQFAHRWNIQFFSSGVDSMLCDRLRTCFGGQVREQDMITATKVLQYAVQADTMELPLSLAFCEQWLVRCFQGLDVPSILFQLSQPSLLRVTRGIIPGLRSNSPYGTLRKF